MTKILSFRDYLYLVELRKRVDCDIEKLLKENLERTLRLLLVESQEFQSIQQDILVRLGQHSLVEQRIPTNQVYSKLIDKSEDFRKIMLKEIVTLFNKDEVSIETVDLVSDLLCEIIYNCDKDIAREFLNNLEIGIDNAFYKDELRNNLHVKVFKRKKL